MANDSINHHKPFNFDNGLRLKKDVIKSKKRNAIIYLNQARVAFQGSSNLAHLINIVTMFDVVI